MTQRLAILGTGAVGAPIGGLLTRAGYDVTLIDQWPENVEAMRSRGLHLTIGDIDDPEFDGTIAVRAMHVHEVCTLREPFDVVFLACKAYDTHWLVHLIEPHLRADGVIVAVQNSLTDEWIAPIVGPARDIGCTLTAGGELLEAGHAWRNRQLGIHYFTIGELSGELSPRIMALETILSKAGKTTVTTNIRGAKWSKLVTNCASAAVSALVDPRRREWDLVGVPEWQQASVQLYQEGVAVGRALGYRMEPLFGMTTDQLLDDPNAIIRAMMVAKRVGASKGATNMIQQDLRKGRPTEVVGCFNGLMMRKGREAGIPTPMNEAMTALYVQLERVEITPSLDNLTRLHAMAAAAGRSGG